MSYKKFYQDITKHSLKPLYLLHGREKLMIDRLMKQLIETALAEKTRQFNHVIRDGRSLDFNAAMGLVERLPIMDQRQIIEIREADFLFDKQWNTQQLARFVDYHDKSTTTVTVLICQQLNNQSAIIKKINKNGAVIKFDALDQTALSSWLVKEAAALNKQISRESASQLANRLGYFHKNSTIDLYGLLSVLQKLASQSDADSIELADLEQFANHGAEANIFKMIDMTFLGNAAAAIQQLDALYRAGQQEFFILKMMSDRISESIKVKQLAQLGFSKQVIAKKLKRKEWQIQKTMRAIEHHRLVQLVQIQREAQLCDLQLKSSVDSKIALENLIMKISLK